MPSADASRALTAPDADALARVQSSSAGASGLGKEGRSREASGIEAFGAGLLAFGAGGRIAVLTMAGSLCRRSEQNKNILAAGNGAAAALSVGGAEEHRESPMKMLLGALALVALTAGGPQRAEAAAWCAFYDSSTYNCGFHTYQQCLDTISGVGGWCQRNFFEGDRRPPDRRQRTRR
jgi:hypothetical protein